jgi:hypothetical protein
VQQVLSLQLEGLLPVERRAVQKIPYPLQGEAALLEEKYLLQPVQIAFRVFTVVVLPVALRAQEPHPVVVVKRPYADTC